MTKYIFSLLMISNLSWAQSINGNVKVAPNLASKVTSSSVLFVIARPEGVQGGMPLAVLRIPNPKFPQAFEIGPKNLMAGGEFKGPLILTAKLSKTGDAISAKGDLLGETVKPKAFTPGTKDLQIILNKEF
jgi:hypothetical protein